MTLVVISVTVSECQLPMILVLQHIHSETQKHVIAVFPSAKCDETSHIIDGTYSKCITNPFISDALAWCCVYGCKFSHDPEGFMLMPNKETRRKIQQKGLFKLSMNTTYLLGTFVDIISVSKQNIDVSKQRKRETISHKIKAIKEDD